MALARKSGSHPVAETARLRATSANIGERQPTNKNFVVLAKNEECIRKVTALVF